MCFRNRFDLPVVPQNKYTPNIMEIVMNIICFYVFRTIRLPRGHCDYSSASFCSMMGRRQTKICMTDRCYEALFRKALTRHIYSKSFPFLLARSWGSRCFFVLQNIWQLLSHGDDGALITSLFPVQPMEAVLLSYRLLLGLSVEALICKLWAICVYVGVCMLNVANRVAKREQPLLSLQTAFMWCFLSQCGPGLSSLHFHYNMICVCVCSSRPLFG